MYVCIVLCISNKLFQINFNSLTNISYKGGFGGSYFKGVGEGRSRFKGQNGERGWEKKVKYVLITLHWISHIFFSASIHRKSIIPHVNFNYHDVLKKLGIVSNLIIFEKCTQMMNFFLALSTIKISVYLWNLYTSKYIFSWYVINGFLLVLTDEWCIPAHYIQETFLVLL